MSVRRHKKHKTRMIKKMKILVIMSNFKLSRTQVKHLRSYVQIKLNLSNTTSLGENI